MWCALVVLLTRLFLYSPNAEEDLCEKHGGNFECFEQSQTRLKGSIDNCYLEFHHIVRKKTPAKMLGIVLESEQEVERGFTYKHCRSYLC